jgi:hypothetical protein
LNYLWRYYRPHAISVATLLGVTSNSSLDAAHSATVGVATDTFRRSNRFAAKPYEVSEWDILSSDKFQDAEETSALDSSVCKEKLWTQKIAESRQANFD